MRRYDDVTQDNSSAEQTPTFTVGMSFLALAPVPELAVQDLEILTIEEVDASGQLHVVHGSGRLVAVCTATASYPGRFILTPVAENAAVDFGLAEAVHGEAHRRTAGLAIDIPVIEQALASDSMTAASVVDMDDYEREQEAAGRRCARISEAIRASYRAAREGGLAHVDARAEAKAAAEAVESNAELVAYVLLCDLGR